MESRLMLRGLFSGMAIAFVLVFLLLVIYFQSVIDPLAVPFALCGAMWMLFITQTHISVPALMGTIISMALAGAFFLRQQPQGAGGSAAGGGDGKGSPQEPVHQPAGADASRGGRYSQPRFEA